MSDVKKIKLKNGATLLYQHQNLNNTTQAVIGFKTGSRCDGEYNGMTHLLEHLWFSGNQKFSDEEMFKFTKTTATTHNAFTSYNLVCTTMDCVSDHFDKMLEYNAEAMVNKHYTQERINQEIEVVGEEILLTDSQDSILTNALTAYSKSYEKGIITGNKDILYSVTPEILKNYIEKYFIGENLIASVVTNLPLEEVVDKFNNSKFAQLPSNANNEIPCEMGLKPDKPPFSYVLSYDYGVENIFVGLLHNVKQEGKFKDIERIDKEILHFFKDIIFNDFSGKMYKKMRLDKQLVYQSYYTTQPLSDSMLSIFCAETSPAKTNECIFAICEAFNEARNEGITEQIYNDALEIVKSAISRDYSKNIEYGDAQMNFELVANNDTYFNNELILERLKTKGREYFDNLFKEVFKEDDITLCMSGDYDVRTVPSIEQIKEWCFTDSMNHSEYCYSTISDTMCDYPELQQLVTGYNQINGMENERENKNGIFGWLKNKLRRKTESDLEMAEAVLER